MREPKNLIAFVTCEFLSPNHLGHRGASSVPLKKPPMALAAWSLARLAALTSSWWTSAPPTSLLDLPPDLLRMLAGMLPPRRQAPCREFLMCHLSLLVFQTICEMFLCLSQAVRSIQALRCSCRRLRSLLPTVHRNKYTFFVLGAEQYVLSLWSSCLSCLGLANAPSLEGPLDITPEVHRFVQVLLLELARSLQCCTLHVWSGVNVLECRSGLCRRGTTLLLHVTC
jgi:hypothetical protein